MKKMSLSVVAFFVVLSSYNLYAAEKADQSQAASPAAQTASSDMKTPAMPVTTAPLESGMSAATTTETKTEEMKAPEKASENLEFVSGEVSAVDEATKTVTVKLYGETEKSQSDKVISVKVNESTDITDGEADRDLKSLTAGTEVDVEYDPTTNTATYIFVY